MKTVFEELVESLRKTEMTSDEIIILLKRHPRCALKSSHQLRHTVGPRLKHLEEHGYTVHRRKYDGRLHYSVS